jgi:hypothetical protein
LHSILITGKMSSQVIDITRSSTLWDIEESLSALRKEVPVKINLPRHLTKNFFKDSWLTSLISNAAMKSGYLTIHDWKDADLNDMKERFASSLIGVLAVYMAKVLESNTQKNAPIDVHEIIERIVYNKRGLFEQSSDGGGKSFSFVSFDASDDDTSALNMPRPLMLSAGDKTEFIEKFLRIKREQIDKVFGLTPQMSLFEQTYEKERNLAVLIYELYENTNQHGRYDENNNLIKGIRSFNIKRHIGSRKDIIHQAESFQELQDYFGGFEENKELKFYEVSISDNGLGIINRFISSRPDYQQDEDFAKMPSLEKLNYIIEKSLSSKLFAGSGKGIRTALSIIGELGGFLTVRTNDCWVYYDGRKEYQSLHLTQVPESNGIANIRGTFYNILLPVSNPHA